MVVRARRYGYTFKAEYNGGRTTDIYIGARPIDVKPVGTYDVAQYKQLDDITPAVLQAALDEWLDNGCGLDYIQNQLPYER